MGYCTVYSSMYRNVVVLVVIVVICVLKLRGTICVNPALICVLHVYELTLIVVCTVPYLRNVWLFMNYVYVLCRNL